MDARLDRARGRRRAASGSRPTPSPDQRPATARHLQRPAADARRRARPMGARPPAGGTGARQRQRRRGLPRPDRGRRRGLRLDLGAPRPRRAASRTGRRPGCSSAAADQIGQALAHDRLAAEAQAAEIARQSDALKSALLQSVSHDLRTPLATIRAAAGTLRPGSGLSAGGPAGERRRDRPRGRVPQPPGDQPARPEPDRGRRAARRARRVRARRPRRADARPAPGRASATGRSRSTSTAPPVEVDPVFLDEAVTNVARERDQVHAGRRADPRVAAAVLRRARSSA